MSCSLSCGFYLCLNLVSIPLAMVKYVQVACIEEAGSGGEGEEEVAASIGKLDADSAAQDMPVELLLVFA